jgi:hypothetical protein
MNPWIFNDVIHISHASHKDKDDLGRPLSRHGHWRPRLYRELSVQSSLYKHKSN